LLIEALYPLHIRRPGGDLHLLPGQLVELDAKEAQRLLTKAHGKVRVIAQEEIVIEPAMKPDGNRLSPIFWERADGSIVGPAQPEFFARVGCGNREEDFWLVIQFDGQTVWIRPDKLRTEWAYDQQVLPKIIEPVKEPR